MEDRRDRRSSYVLCDHIIADTRPRPDTGSPLGQIKATVTAALSRTNSAIQPPIRYLYSSCLHTYGLTQKLRACNTWSLNIPRFDIYRHVRSCEPEKQEPDKLVWQGWNSPEASLTENGPLLHSCHISKRGTSQDKKGQYRGQFHKKGATNWPKIGATLMTNLYLNCFQWSSIKPTLYNPDHTDNLHRIMFYFDRLRTMTVGRCVSTKMFKRQDLRSVNIT